MNLTGNITRDFGGRFVASPEIMMHSFRSYAGIIMLVTAVTNLLFNREYPTDPFIWIFLIQGLNTCILTILKLRRRPDNRLSKSQIIVLGMIELSCGVHHTICILYVQGASPIIWAFGCALCCYNLTEIITDI